METTDLSPKHLNVDSQPRLWAISEYYHPNFSGAAIQAQRILARLVSRGIPVEVLTQADHAASAKRGQRIALEGVIVHYLPVVRLRAWNSLASWPSLRRLAQQVNAKLRDASFHLALLLTVLFRVRRGEIVQWYVVSDFSWVVFFVAHVLGRHQVIQVSLLGADDPASFQPTLLGISTRAKRACFRLADFIVGLSRALTQRCELPNLPADRIIRIPNGVDTTWFSPAAGERDAICRQLTLDDRRRYIVFVGSAIYRKGIDLAVRSFAQFAVQHTNVDLLVVGPAEFREQTRFASERQQLVDELRAELRDAGLIDRVLWLGLQSDVRTYLRAADVFLFPTRREGLPNSVAEAMSCGLPIIASRLSGITTDLIDDQVEGLLIERFEPAAYADALRQLWSDVSRREAMGRAARQRIEREFSIGHVVEQYTQLYCCFRPK